MQQIEIILIVVVLVVILAAIVFCLLCYKKCPADKIMVIYGKHRNNADGTTCYFKCIHGGAVFVYPIFQSVEYLDLTPIPIEINLMGALSRENVCIKVLARFTVGISTERDVMQNAAERLVGIKPFEIQMLSEDIIMGQLRLAIALSDIEEINADRDKFLETVAINIECEIKKIGLRLINVNIVNISKE